MTVKLPALALGLAVAASAAQADMVVINGRYVVAKETVRGYFYRNSTQQVVFDVRWNEWSTQYRCRDEYDRGRIEAASLNLVLELEKARSLDFGAFLEGQGFEDCKKF